MNKKEITDYFSRLDEAMNGPADLYLYGSAVVILLDAPDRTSLDIDVAGPYSVADQGELARASISAGLPINPDVSYTGNHLEWVGPLRLCLPPPKSDTPGMLLWQGKRLLVRTAAVPDLVASKLIRYDETDRSDIQYLFAQFHFDWESVCQSVARLPHPFSNDVLVLENLNYLKSDMQLWSGPK
jgi:hypothetical protein